jgi:hypothetical protein
MALPSHSVSDRSWRVNILLPMSVHVRICLLKSSFCFFRPALAEHCEAILKNQINPLPGAADSIWSGFSSPRCQPGIVAVDQPLARFGPSPLIYWIVSLFSTRILGFLHGVPPASNIVCSSAEHDSCHMHCVCETEFVWNDFVCRVWDLSL